MTEPAQRIIASLGVDASSCLAPWALEDIVYERPLAAGIIRCDDDDPIDVLPPALEALAAEFARHGIDVVAVSIEQPLRATPARTATIIEMTARRIWPRAAVRIVHNTDWKSMCGIESGAKKPVVMEWARAHDWNLSVAGPKYEDEIADAAGLARAGVVYPHWWLSEGEAIFERREKDRKKRREREEAKRLKRQAA